LVFKSRGDRIRTCDLVLPKDSNYQMRFPLNLSYSLNYLRTVEHFETQNRDIFEDYVRSL